MENDENEDAKWERRPSTLVQLIPAVPRAACSTPTPRRTFVFSSTASKKQSASKSSQSGGAVAGESFSSPSWASEESSVMEEKKKELKLAFAANNASLSRDASGKLEWHDVLDYENQFRRKRNLSDCDFDASNCFDPRVVSDDIPIEDLRVDEGSFYGSSVGSSPEEFLLKDGSLASTEDGSAVNTEWTHAVILCTMRNDDENTTVELYTRRGRKFLPVQNDKIAFKMHVGCRVKYNYVGNELEMKKLSSCPFFSINMKMNKSITMKTIGIMGHLNKEAVQSNKHYVLWTDDIGLLYILTEDMSPGRKNREVVPKDYLSAEKKGTVFRAMKLMQLVLECPHSTQEFFEINKRSWHIVNIRELAEESSRGSQIPNSSWPEYVQRVDDIILVHEDEYKAFFKSPTFPTRRITCDQAHMQVKKKEKLRPLTAVMVPQSSYPDNNWTCLVVAPLQLLNDLSKGRIFNYLPMDYLERNRRKEAQMF